MTLKPRSSQLDAQTPGPEHRTRAPEPHASLTVRRMAIDTHPENTVFLLRHGNGYSAEQYQALRKLRVSAGQAEILATLALVDDESMLGRGQIGLGEQAFRRLGCADGTAVAIEQARPPASLEFVRRKIGGDMLDANAIAAVVRDVAAFRYSPMEIGAFLVACAGSMSTEETLSLTRAMIDVGNRLHWDAPLVVDKHCIGGCCQSNCTGRSETELCPHLSGALELDFGRTPPILELSRRDERTDSATFMFARG